MTLARFSLTQDRVSCENRPSPVSDKDLVTLLETVVNKTELMGVCPVSLLAALL